MNPNYGTAAELSGYQTNPVDVGQYRTQHAKQQIINMLLAKGMQPNQGQMVGRFYVPQSWAQDLASLAQVGAGTGGQLLLNKEITDNAATKEGKMQEVAKAYHANLEKARQPTAVQGPDVTTDSNLEAIMASANPPTAPMAPPDVRGFNPKAPGVMGVTQTLMDRQREQVVPGPGAPVPQFDPHISAGLAPNPGQAEGPRPTAPTPPPTPPPMAYQPGTTTPGAMTMQPADPRQAEAVMREAMMNPDNPFVRQTATLDREQAQKEKELAAQREFLGVQGEENRAVRREGIESNALTRAEMIRGNMLTTQAQIDARTQAGQDTNALKMELQRQNADLQKTLHAMDNASREKIGSGHDAARESATGATAGKKGEMPPAALKMKTDALDAIGSASALNADLNAIHDQITSGKINLGPMKNLMATGKNLLGMSDEQSRNYATFKATLEKQRNESLRLNKGVQTEGDSVRAWNELIENINDPKVVAQRLKEIQSLNERAVGLHKMNLDMIQKNYNLDPIDTSAYEKQPAAVGAGVRKYNPATGKIE